MKKSSHSMAAFLFDNAKALGEAKMRGELYRISWYPGAVYNPELSTYVYGELFEIQEETTLFKQLDKYEGVGVEFPVPNEYERIKVFVEFDNQEVESWIYNYNISLLGAGKITSGKFYNV